MPDGELSALVRQKTPPSPSLSVVPPAAGLLPCPTPLRCSWVPQLSAACAGGQGRTLPVPPTSAHQSAATPAPTQQKHWWAGSPDCSADDIWRHLAVGQLCSGSLTPTLLRLASYEEGKHAGSLTRMPAHVVATCIASLCASVKLAGTVTTACAAD